MGGLALSHFLSSAMGIRRGVALIRAIKRTTFGTIGNFWVGQQTRTLLYVLLPASIIGALLMVAQGVPQNLNAYTGGTYAGAAFPDADHRAGPEWPARGHQMLGTDGGGFSTPTRTSLRESHTG